MEKLKKKTSKTKSNRPTVQPPRQWTRYALMVERTEKNEKIPRAIVRGILQAAAERIFDGRKILKVEVVFIDSCASQ